MMDQPKQLSGGAGSAVLLVLIAMALSISGCGSTGKTPPSMVLHEEDYDPFDPDRLPPEVYVIRPGDGVSVRFLYNSELDTINIIVRQDGMITIPVIGDILAAGRTPEEVEEEIRQRLQAFVQETGYGQKLRAGDELQVRFTYNPQLNQRVVIRPDGGISLLKVGEMQVEGVSFREFETKLRTEYKKYIREPEMSVYLLATRTRKIYSEPGDLTVMVTNPQPRQIYVGGQVGQPTLIQFRDWLTPLQAVSQSGGILSDGDGSRVVYITRGPRGEAITTRLNLDSYLQGGRKSNLYLRHGDILFVPRSGIGKLNLAVRQFIRDSLPIITTLSFNYVLNEDNNRSSGSTIVRTGSASGTQ